MSALKLRIKYEKTGVLRFIGHLDVMRYFQKAIRRAGLDVAYSKGFSPHQIISFAAPMPLGMTSSGEYFDGEFESVTSSVDMINRLNDVMAEGIRVLDITRLPDDAKPSMAVVSASDYFVYKNDESENDYIDRLTASIDDLMSKEKINVLKKTKTKEELADIKPYIYELTAFEYHMPDEFFNGGFEFPADNKQGGMGKEKKGIYMLLASGSKMNVKPDLVIGALAEHAGIKYTPYDYRIHRIETYMGDKEALVPLFTAGNKF
ncbi:MAG: TIGR03936 family radical SAM-associated protein [Clostridium sp.]|nr:TIGR03936 family radical SAM-associated protein [Clostridium sp.]MCM1173145.1 TIGR03936 family radical SAM-associated protein [Clostridium sp.]MCM1209731.1 TIGR03936 family radical SAM-associated protein [Ruminococcus sp.]